MLSRQSVLSCTAINEILMSAALPTKNIFIVFIKKTNPMKLWYSSRCCTVKMMMMQPRSVPFSIALLN